MVLTETESEAEFGHLGDIFREVEQQRLDMDRKEREEDIYEEHLRST